MDLDLGEILGMLDDLDDTSMVSLNEWESEFIDSLMKQIDDGRSPTSSQLSKLKQIHTSNIES